ncbi:MAG: transcriptional repressor [Alphaproteobacteria bacterium]|nr:transcriptional repressor [Alphaproteobacteria bacterium]
MADAGSPFHEAPHDHHACVAAALAAADLVCRQKGARLTALRRRVLELIWSRHAPARAYDILEQLKGERGGAAPPTVYRALDFLIEHGLVHRIESLNAFVGCNDPRYGHSAQFLICRRCGTIAELEDAEVARLVRARAAALGFRVSHQTIEIAGLCPGCDAGSGDPTHAA